MIKSLKKEILDCTNQVKFPTYSYIVEDIYQNSRGDIPRAKIGKTLIKMENDSLKRKWKNETDGGFWYYKKI